MKKCEEFKKENEKFKEENKRLSKYNVSLQEENEEFKKENKELKKEKESRNASFHQDKNYKYSDPHDINVNPPVKINEKLKKLHAHLKQIVST